VSAQGALGGKDFRGKKRLNVPQKTRKDKRQPRRRTRSIGGKSSDNVPSMRERKQKIDSESGPNHKGIRGGRRGSKEGNKNSKRTGGEKEVARKQQKCNVPQGGTRDGAHMMSNDRRREILRAAHNAKKTSSETEKKKKKKRFKGPREKGVQRGDGAGG